MMIDVTILAVAMMRERGRSLFALNFNCELVRYSNEARNCSRSQHAVIVTIILQFYKIILHCPTELCYVLEFKLPCCSKAGALCKSLDAIQNL